MNLRTVNVTRYIQPLREGGSLPALAEADDGFKYVVKFRGSGHGSKALISELLGGVVARKLKLKIPELVFIQLDKAFGLRQADEEIQDLLRASRGLNLGLHFLTGALPFDPVTTQPNAQLSSRIVWMDSFLTNVDRTVKNTNMLMWHKELWLIDHGSTLYFHHNRTNWEKASVNLFQYVKEHVLLPFTTESELVSADEYAKQILTDDVLHELTNLIPDEWTGWKEDDETADDIREVYFQFLSNRLKHSDIFLNEALNARKVLI